MFLKFVNKKTSVTEPKRKKLPKPMTLGDKVGSNLVTQMKQDPSWIWQLEMVIRPDEAQPKKINFRVFEPSRTMAAKLNVQDFHSLDAYPEQILWEGWYHKDDYHVYFTNDKQD